MNGDPIRRGDVWWVSLDPTQGSEIKKTRPCLVLTHDTLNKLRQTVVVVPLSTSAKAHPPVTIAVECKGNPAVAVIDQVRAVAKHRLKSRMATMPPIFVEAVTDALSSILNLRK